MSHILEQQKERLMHDLRMVITDSEALLKSTADEAEGGFNEARTQIHDRLLSAKNTLRQLQESALHRVEAVGHATDRYVHDHPWHAIGLAGGLGLLIGLLMERR